MFVTYPYRWQTHISSNYHNFFKLCPIDWHLHWLQFLANSNNAAMNIFALLSWHSLVNESIKWIPRSRIAGSKCKCTHTYFDICCEIALQKFPLLPKVFKNAIFHTLLSALAISSFSMFINLMAKVGVLSSLFLQRILRISRSCWECRLRGQILSRKSDAAIS